MIDESDLGIFMSLGNLFTPTPIRLENGTRWKPNSQEVLDGFILHIKVIFVFLNKILCYFLQLLHFYLFISTEI